MPELKPVDTLKDKVNQLQPQAITQESGVLNPLQPQAVTPGISVLNPLTPQAVTPGISVLNPLTPQAVTPEASVLNPRLPQAIIQEASVSSIHCCLKLLCRNPSHSTCLPPAFLTFRLWNLKTINRATLYSISI